MGWGNSACPKQSPAQAGCRDRWTDGQMAFLFPVLSPTAILVRALLLTQAAAAAGNISPFTTMLSLMIVDRHVKKKKVPFYMFWVFKNS